jgi:hypothetical protein
VSAAAPEQTILADERRMVITLVGNTVDQKVVAVAWDALYYTTP